METKILDGQSTLDIAIQTGGSIEAVFDLAERNEISITDILAPSQMLSNPAPVNNNILAYYNMKGLTPATDAKELEAGIEFWYIEWDFVVS